MSKELPQVLFSDDGDFYACPGWVTERTLLRHVFAEDVSVKGDLFEAYSVTSVRALEREISVTHGYMRPMTAEEAGQSGYTVGEGWCWAQAGDDGAAKFTWMEE